MLSRRSVLTLGLLFAMTPWSAQAAMPFTVDAFAAAQKAGKPILVEISAPWCPTCRAQQPIIQTLSEKPAYRSVMVFRVDFDSQKDALRSFNARSQSTLIAFRGEKELDRSVGDTDPASIEALIAKTVAK
jgi:thioredoxin 1